MTSPYFLDPPLFIYVSFEYSKISPGWQSKASQMDSNVEKRIALAFPVLRMERLAVVIPTFSASSLLFISRLASIMSKLIKIAILKWLGHFLVLSHSHHESNLPRSI